MFDIFKKRTPANNLVKVASKEWLDCKPLTKQGIWQD